MSAPSTCQEREAFPCSCSLAPRARCSLHMELEPVPLVDLSTQHRELEGELNQAFLRVLRSGQYVLGPNVASFEAALAKEVESPWVIATSSGTDALLCALMALGIGVGDEVVT